VNVRTNGASAFPARSVTPEESDSVNPTDVRSTLVTVSVATLPSAERAKVNGIGAEGVAVVSRRTVSPDFNVDVSITSSKVMATDVVPATTSRT
jgi:hypothetical protein